MTDEVQISAEVPAPELEATAAPETEVIQPEEKPAEASKTFTQEELDAAIGKRLAREQRKWEREQAQRAAQAQAPRVPVDIPPADQFESVEAYAEALATRMPVEIRSCVVCMDLFVALRFCSAVMAEALVKRLVIGMIALAKSAIAMIDFIFDSFILFISL